MEPSKRHSLISLLFILNFFLVLNDIDVAIVARYNWNNLLDLIHTGKHMQDL